MGKPMMYLKSILMGMAALIVSLIVYVAISVLPLVAQWRDSGSGGIGIVSTNFTIGPVFWIVAALIFAAGFWWQFRRGGQTTQSRSRESGNH
jgi:heme/copper-type cytochrome/quinol oxidase subunit 2